MKKLLYCAAALATILFAGSCQRENLEPAVEGATVTYTVKVPGAMTTKASGTYSGEVNELIYEVHRVNDDETSERLYQKSAEISAGVANVDIEVVKDQNFTILFWAQKKDVAFGTDNLTAVTMPTALTANVEDYEAFYGKDEFVYATDITLTNTVELTRAVSMLNVGTTQKSLNVGGEAGNVTLQESAVTVKDLPNTLNIMTGVADNDADAVYNYATDDAVTVPAGTLTVGGEDYVYVAKNYVGFADAGKSTVDVTLTILTDEGTITHEIPSVPFQRNYKTNIVGDLITANAKYSVTLTDDWAQDTHDIVLVSDAADLQEAINGAAPGEETEIKLGGDIDLNDLSALIGPLSTKAGAEPKPYGIEIPSGKAIVLDLNGCNITVSKAESGRSLYALNNKGALTIKDTKGTGSISARGIYNGYNDSNTDEKVDGAKMIIESGNFYAIDGDGGAAVFNCAELVINGGLFDGLQAAVNTRLSGKAEINGGTFRSVAGYAIQNRGEMTLNDATVDCGFGAVGLYGGNTIINDGQFYPTCNYAGYTCHVVYLNDSSVNLTINGGVFKMNYPETSVPDSGEAVANYYKGTLTINGGTFYAHFDNVSPVQLSEGSTIKGGTFYNHSGVPSQHVWVKNYVDDAYELKENGEVVAKPVVTVNGVSYTTLAEAVASAKAGDTVTLLRDVTLSEELTLPAGIVFNGNGKQINGTIYAGGDLTFAGHTKVTAFSASYYNRIITIGEGACLEVTGSGRVTLGYGNTFNITGSLENAKEADKANVQPSLIIPGGMSITGGNDATMNVTNAYVKIGSTTSKNSAANGKFTLNFINSIAEFTKEFGFYEPTGSMNPTFEMNVTNSVFTTGTKLCVAASNSTVNVDNSTVALGNYLRNSGNLNLTNGSTLTGKTIQFGENGGNNGKINVDASTLTVVAGGTGHAFDGKGTGVIRLVNGAKANIDYLQNMILDTTGGELTFTKQINCVIQIAEGLTKDYSNNIYNVSSAAGLEKMNQMLVDMKAGLGVVLNLIADIDFEGKTWIPVRSHIDWKSTVNEFNGNGHTISNLTVNGQAMFTIFANSHDVVVKNVTFDNAKVTCNGINSAIIVGQTYNNLLLENVDVKNSSVTGNYKVATLVGSVYNESTSTITATLKNCDVTNTSIKSTQYDFCTSGMVAFVNAGDNDAVVFENCTVSDVKLYAPNIYTAHAAIYTTGSDTLFNEAEGVTVTNVTFEAI